MPRYHKDYSRGYDLDRELDFAEHDGIRYRLGSAGSYIMVCMTCGAETFRDRTDNALCIGHPEHGPTVPLTFENEPQALKIWAAAGDRLTTVEERRRDRLVKEAGPWGGWKFGTKTEADYPLGYASETTSL